jgi:DNA-binding protein HU-beta
MRIEQIGDYLKSKVKGLSKTQGEEAYKALVDLIHEEANKNGKEDVKIALPKLGNLTIKYKGEYQGKNPSTGEPMTVAPMRRATFSSFDSFKDVINEPLNGKKEKK